MVERLTAGTTEEGLSEPATKRYEPGKTVFDRFAGVYHAFERLHDHIAKALDAERLAEAEQLLLGEKFDSLPVLLRAVVERDDSDPILAYVTFLSARQLRDRVAKIYPEFLRQYPIGRDRLDTLISGSPALRNRIGLDGDDADEFFQWYESQFLRLIEQPEPVE